MSINNLFNIGESALRAQQSNINVTGNNIANVDTPGYSRQYVQLEDAYALTTNPGAMPQGVDAVQVLRRFDQFVEVSFLDKSSIASRWQQQHTTMTSVESIFNESNRTGISDSLASFFQAWQDLALRPDDPATRQDLLSRSDDLSLLMRQSAEDLQQIREQADLAIQVDVDRANELIESIAELNQQITKSTIENVSNPNDLLDKRDTAIRELAEIIDITVQYGDGNNTTVRLASGQPLVQGQETFSLEFLGPRSESNKIADSTYTGDIIFDGEGSHEYTVEMLSGGSVGDVPPPTYRVSLDGGQTWLRNTDGTEKHFEVTDANGDGAVDPVQAHDLKISFSELDNFTAEDRFVIVPKNALYYIEPTKGPENITPQTYLDSTENQNRVAGGTLAAHFAVRDEHVGTYEDELDAVAKTLIWEVNKLHSQGSGLDHVNSFYGTESVEDSVIPLGTAQSGLQFYDRLTTGNFQMNFYDAETDTYLEGGSIDFSTVTPGVADFDPSVHTLEDVAAAINNTHGTYVRAEIVDKKLQLTSTDQSYTFSMGSDSTGLMASLGVNSFFTGTSASDLSVNMELHTDLNRIAAGYIDGSNAANPGDNARAANDIGSLLTDEVSITTPWRNVGNQSISEYYSTLVSKVGAATRTAETNAEYNTALAYDLSVQQQQISGVSLDEEMANLIQFQHAYTAAAKLITTADQMLQTLLGLKQ